MFAFDTNTLPPGGFRLPNDNERRDFLYFQTPFRDCTTVCALNPDLEEKNDAIARVLALAPELLYAAMAVLDNPGGEAELADLRSTVEATKVPRP